MGLDCPLYEVEQVTRQRTLLNLLVSEYIKVRRLNTVIAQQGTDLPRKAAARILGRFFHEENDFGLLHKLMYALIERRRICRHRPGGRNLISLGKRWWGSASQARMFRKSLGEDNGVCTRDVVEKCMALRPGGRMAPKGK